MVQVSSDLHESSLLAKARILTHSRAFLGRNLGAETRIDAMIVPRRGLESAKSLLRGIIVPSPRTPSHNI